MSANISPEQARIRDRRESALIGVAFLFLTIASIGLLLSPSARVGSWPLLLDRWQHLLVLPVWLFCVLLARWQAKLHLPHRDPLFLPLGFLLAGWGTLTIWRLLPSFGLRQTGWLVVGTFVLLLIIRRGTKLAWLKRYRYIWLIAGLILTGLTLLFGTHPSGGDPHLWLGWGGVYIQPSEFLRLLLIAYFASFLADRVSLAWDQEDVSLQGVLGPLVVVWVLSIGLLFVQRDLGTGTLFMGLLAVLLYLTTGRSEIIYLGGIAIVLAGLAASLTVGIVQARMLAWLNPWSDPIGVGYQIIQASMSMAAGGVFGQGIGLGAPGFVPAAHTDFIFTAIVEEWGLLGGLGLLAVLALLVHRGLRAARSMSSTFRLILAAGLSLGMGLQTILIIGGVLRLLPLTGITVPFVSYGGSSLVTSFAGLAILLKISGASGGRNRYRPRLSYLQSGWLLGVGLLALALGWWTVIQAPELRSRSDNPRRALAERYSRRGTILDRNGLPLAESVGSVGSFNRQYPAEAAAPVVGFSSERYGQAGIEAQLDGLLRGERGYPAWQVWWHRLLHATPPPGNDVRLTISLPAQQRAVEALEGHVGAAVIMDGGNGDVLAIASAPTFNAARLDEQWERLTTDPESPMLNRATQARYQPGVSLASMIDAWAQAQGIEIGDEGIDFSKPVPIEGQLLSCAWPLGEAPIESGELALRFGCPQPPGLMAKALGSESMADFVGAFGLRDDLNLPLEGGAGWQGAVPQEAEALAAFGYGQGGMTVTPLHVLRAFAGLSVGKGELPPVVLVDAIKPPGGNWQATDLGERDERAVSASAAQATLQKLNQAPFIEYAAEAVAGEAGQLLGWWMAADPDHPNQLAILIVLEEESGMTARSLGLGLFKEVQALLP